MAGHNEKKAAKTTGAVFLTAAIYLLWLLLSLVLKEESAILERGVVLETAVLIIPTVFWCVLRGEEQGKRLRIAFFSPAKTVFLLLFTAAMLCAALIAGIMTGSGSAETALGVSLSGENSLLAALCLAVVPAAAEELFFRGLLLSELEDAGAGTSVLLSSLFFAMFHFSLSGLPLTFFCGVLLALCVYVTRSLLASVAIHIAYNLIALFGARQFASFLSITDSPLLPAALLGVALLLCLILIAGECQRTYAAYALQNDLAQKKAPRGGAAAFLSTLFSPASAACIIIFILALFIRNS